jgi:hypothetical protein
MSSVTPAPFGKTKCGWKKLAVDEKTNDAKETMGALTDVPPDSRCGQR